MSDTQDPAELERKTSGLSGQEGYDSTFKDGAYQDDATAESGVVPDRAGSYEDGYAAPKRDEALPAQPPEPHTGRRDPSNNYTAPHDGDKPAMSEEE